MVYKLVNDLFDGFYHYKTPIIKIGVIDNGYNIKIGLLGVDKEDVNIEIVSDYLIVNYKPKEEKDDIFIDDFNEKFLIPDDVDVNKTKAIFKNGILDITLPFLNKKKKNVKIEIE